MTIDEKVEAFRMRLEGNTIQEIANRFGVSKQYISKELRTERIRSNEKIVNACVYPNIRKFLVRERLTCRDFSNEFGISYATLYNILTGKAEPRKKTIDRILKCTGLTYEEAFSKD